MTETSKEWRERMYREGNCKRCGHKRDRMEVNYCDACLQRDKERMEAQRRRRIETPGVCGECGKKSPHGEQCKKCRARIRLAQDRLRDRRRDAGLCERCGAKMYGSCTVRCGVCNEIDKVHKYGRIH